MAVFSTTDAVIILDADAAGHSTADAAAGGGCRPGSSSSGTRSGEQSRFLPSGAPDNPAGKPFLTV
jgi:hypothetical protein